MERLRYPDGGTVEQGIPFTGVVPSDHLALLSMALEFVDTGTLPDAPDGISLGQNWQDHLTERDVQFSQEDLPNGQIVLTLRNNARSGIVLINPGSKTVIVDGHNNFPQG